VVGLPCSLLGRVIGASGLGAFALHYLGLRTVLFALGSAKPAVMGFSLAGFQAFSTAAWIWTTERYSAGIGSDHPQGS